MRRFIKIGLLLVVAVLSVLILTSGAEDPQDDMRIAGPWIMRVPIDSVDVEVEWMFYNDHRFQWRAYGLTDTLREFWTLAQGRWAFEDDTLTLKYEDEGEEQAAAVFATVSDRDVVQLHYTTGDTQTLYRRPE